MESKMPNMSKWIALFTSVFVSLILGYHLVRVLFFNISLSPIILVCTLFTLLLNGFSYFKGLFK